MQPQPPDSAPTPPTAATPSAPPSHRPAGPLVAALAVGLLLGAGGVGAAWALGGDDGDTPGSGPTGDAHAACGALDGFDPAKYGAKGEDGVIALNRYAAAGTLAASAAAGDTRYKPLAEAIRRSQDRHLREFEFTAAVRKDLDKARSLCDDL
ncbi:hypothetical protein [Streptomyces sp. NPDC048636]|uniref:hypothetical protein n=1 Tax=Streptomyces sp. NPDC048636 TaxID=3155762 RepID=UPI0034289350